MAHAQIGICFDRTYPAARIAECARSAEYHGLDQLWVIEDCFFTAGVSLAATALAVTESLQVGIGIMPAVARNPAITAMEIATLANLAPDRFIAGIGHGVQSWMGQMGARTPSPLTTLDETITVVKQLLAGDKVTFDGREVHLDGVQLDQPPLRVPAVLAGVQQTKSLALAGRVADGIILAEGSGPTYVRWALEQAGHPAPFDVTLFTLMAVAADRKDAYRRVAPFVAGLVGEHRPSMTVLPFFADMAARVAADGPDGLIEMPADHWMEIGAIGTIDDARAHVTALEGAGVGSINVFPLEPLTAFMERLPEVAALSDR